MSEKKEPDYKEMWGKLKRWLERKDVYGLKRELVLNKMDELEEKK